MSNPAEAAGSMPGYASSEKTPSGKNSKKPKPKSTHPPVSSMVNKAIKGLNKSEGSSVRAIKKYIASNFVVNVEKMGPAVKRYLTRAVENKVLLQTKGKGLSGSYKLISTAVQQGTTKNQLTALEVDKKITKKSKMLVLKGRKTISSQQAREGAKKPIAKKSSKTSTATGKSNLSKA